MTYLGFKLTSQRKWGINFNYYLFKSIFIQESSHFSSVNLIQQYEYYSLVKQTVSLLCCQTITTWIRDSHG